MAIELTNTLEHFDPEAFELAKRVDMGRVSKKARPIVEFILVRCMQELRYSSWYSSIPEELEPQTTIVFDCFRELTREEELRAQGLKTHVAVFTATCEEEDYKYKHLF